MAGHSGHSGHSQCQHESNNQKVGRVFSFFFSLFFFFPLFLKKKNNFFYLFIFKNFLYYFVDVVPNSGEMVPELDSLPAS